MPRLIHGICTYHGQWISGDSRGFRAVDHKVHSSGDYKHPPPRSEHEGLRLWVKAHMNSKPVLLRPPEYAVLGASFVHRIHEIGASVRCLSCGPTHVHLLYDSVAADAKKELGRAKQYASLKLSCRPGRVWAKDCFVEEVDVPHARELWKYILQHARKEDAWIYRFDRDDVPTRDDIAEALRGCVSRLRGIRV